MFPPTPPYGVQYGPRQPPPLRPGPGPVVAVFVVVGILLAGVMAALPLMGVLDLVDDPDTAVRTSAPPATPADPPRDRTYRVLDGAEWAAVVADPGSHVGARIVVTGRLVAPPPPGGDTAYAELGGLPAGDGEAHATTVVVVGTERTWRAVPPGGPIQLHATVAGSRAEPDGERRVVLTAGDLGVVTLAETS